MDISGCFMCAFASAGLCYAKEAIFHIGMVLYSECVHKCNEPLVRVHEKLTSLASHDLVSFPQ